ncbi:interaptin [Manduca sexta]|uniref:interaptin n=1 Tax=Manduca sexta TaxID=7130 RepID=UPI00188F0A05|nr:interaptin [Manduca sexta]
MRRGHPSIGGWRGENPRHFRPRGGIQQHYMPPRNYGMPEIPRFTPSAPGPRMHRPAHYGTHTDEYRTRDHLERKPYRGANHKSAPQRSHDRNRYQNKSGMRHIIPFIQHARHKENHGSYVEEDFYTENQPIHTGHVNNMGDVDHRLQPSTPKHHNSFTNPHVNTSWNNQQQKSRPPYENRSPQKTFRLQESGETHKKPLLDYPGHRPPASDYYGGTPNTMTSANNTSFSRSVDDTVDIVRKRLMHRNESQSSQEDNSVTNSHSDLTTENNTYPPSQSGQIPKKKILPPKPTVKSNCDKMKNKIVHQLFKMDKDKIHKLMDNPNSSTKFEYAISSLITESQNSLNRHLRSIAEKSLCSSSEDFINNDNNTIYEDTFMKQMQCILDPQDTILLEDIKPLVMAELTKVLQLDEVDQTQTVTEIERPDLHNLSNEHTDYAYPESYNYEDYPQDIYCDIKDYIPNEFSENASNTETNSSYDLSSSYQQDIKPLFERRPAKRIDYEQERKKSSESRNSGRNLDIKPVIDEHSIYNLNQEPTDLFDVHCEQLSEDDDPFAELDKQYHVPVDHNFIEHDEIANIQSSVYNNKLLHTENESANATSTLDTLDESFASLHGEHHDTTPPSITKEEQENKSTAISAKPNDVPNLIETIDIKTDNLPKTKSLDKKEPDKSTSTNIIKSSSNSRKRSIDQRPSHRKEKRKKSESSPSDHNKNISNKVINEQTPKNTESCEGSTKTVLCLFSQQNANCKEPIKDNKRSKSVDKGYSDKYVKRKESRKKSVDTKTPKKRTTSTSGHSSISPKENTSSSGQISTQQEAKAKLQTIDIFTTKPKKINFHQAHRNTALVPSPVKGIEKDKPKPQTGSNILKDESKSAKKLQSKETQTFESKISTSRFCQTEKKKLVVKAIQTEPVTFEKSKIKSKDAFERMKEIDLEIQVLLQEKFQLYSSLESKDSCSNTMQDLGMTVLNVAPYEETKDDDDNSLENVLTGDAIVDDFTSIPVEELEQIALETVQEEEENAGRYEKRTRRMTQKLLEQERSGSPMTSRRSNKKIKTPNISLLEQIITDDRPLEDIIVLDELESTPVKTTKKKSQRNQSTKKKLAAKKKSKPLDIPSNNLRACSVVLCRINVSPYLDKEESNNDEGKEQIPDTEGDKPIEKEKPEEPQLSILQASIPEPTEIVEETVVNDLQFDMLDVSEDIVIEENSDNNLLDRGPIDRSHITINEEIILGNSQSSSDDVYVLESAQGEAECKMYDYSTDENLRRDSVTVTGNGDAVLAIECIENNFIAACLDGNVYHFSGDGQLINTLRGSNLAVTCLTIVKEKYGTTVYTGSLDSRIRYYDLDTGVEKGPECNVLSPIQTMDRAWDTVFVGTRTGFVLQFECKNNMLIPVSTVKFSEQSILALRAMKEGPRKVLLVAARSENVTVKDAQTGLLLRTLSGPKMTVYTLLFEDGKVYCGTSSHQIHVFDYATGGHVGSHEGGKGAVCLRATGGLVFAGCYDGCVYVYREGETRPLAQLRGPSLMLLSLAVVGSKIIAGYKDRSLYIWKIPLSILQEMIL